MQRIICFFLLFLISISKAHSDIDDLIDGISFQQYKEAISLEDIYIAYVQPSFISPMSYFGHSFLVFKKKNSWDFSKTFLFSAVIPSDITSSGLFYKGSFGHLEGRFVLSNFHKIKHNYLNKEQRGIELYKLVLNEFEKELLLRKSFNLYNEPLRYNFFQNNCSSELIKYLSVIKPSLYQEEKNMAIKQPSNAIELLANEGILNKTPITHFSKLELEFHKYQALTLPEKRSLRSLLDGENDYATLTDNRLKSALVGQGDLLFKYAKTPLAEHESIQKLLYKDNYSLSPLKKQFQNLNTSLVSFGFKSIGSHDYTTLRFMPAAYTHSDVRFSRVNETTMVIFNTELKIEDTNIDLYQFDLLELATYNKSFSKTTTPSWRFYMGFNENHNEDGSFQSEFAYGLSYGTDNLLISLLPQLNIDFSHSMLFTQVNFTASYWMGQSNISYNLVSDVFTSNRKGNKSFHELIINHPINPIWSVSLAAREGNKELGITLNRRF